MYTPRDGLVLDILKQIQGMTVEELLELNKKLKDKLNEPPAAGVGAETQGPEPVLSGEAKEVPEMW